MKYIMSFLLLSLIFLVIPQDILSQEQSEGEIFTDSQNRYTIELPPEWEIFTEEGETIFASTRSKTDFATCYIFGFPVEEGLTLDEMADWLMEGFEQGGEDYEFKVLKKVETKVAGVRALLIRQQEKYKESEKDEKFVTIWIDEYFFIKNGQGIILHFDTTQESYEKFKADFAKIAGTFTLGVEPFPDVIEFQEEGDKPSDEGNSGKNK